MFDEFHKLVLCNWRVNARKIVKAADISLLDWRCWGSRMRTDLVISASVSAFPCLCFLIFLLFLPLASLFALSLWILPHSAHSAFTAAFPFKFPSSYLDGFTFMRRQRLACLLRSWFSSRCSPSLRVFLQVCRTWGRWQSKFIPKSLRKRSFAFPRPPYSSLSY